MIRGHDGAQLNIPAALNPRVGLSIETDDVLWYWNTDTEQYERTGAGEMEKKEDPRMQTVAYVVATFIAVCAVALLAAGTVKLIMWMF